jgi:hypothetical protein
VHTNQVLMMPISVIEMHENYQSKFLRDILYGMGCR